MARQTDAIRQEIDVKRREIDEDITRLRQELNERMDWRWQVRTRPFAAVGVGLLLGLLAGLVVIR